jgi:hypothetical protein
MKLALRALIAAGGAILVTGAGFAALIMGVHSPGPAQIAFQSIAFPVVSLSLFFDWLPLNNFTAWLAVALGGILWFALIFAGLGVFQRRGTAGT